MWTACGFDRLLLLWLPLHKHLGGACFHRACNRWCLLSLVPLHKRLGSACFQGACTMCCCYCRLLLVLLRRLLVGACVIRSRARCPLVYIPLLLLLLLLLLQLLLLSRGQVLCHFHPGGKQLIHLLLLRLLLGDRQAGPSKQTLARRPSNRVLSPLPMVLVVGHPPVLAVHQGSMLLCIVWDGHPHTRHTRPPRESDL